jgi:hypothetical protein
MAPPPSGSSSICWVGLAINTRLKVMSE